jgi:hypothetical protein
VHYHAVGVFSCALSEECLLFAYFKMMTIMSTYISLVRQQVFALVDQTVDEAR